MRRLSILPEQRDKPVFADVSGQRRLFLRQLGLRFAVVLAAFLGVVVVGMTGGPTAPPTRWTAPKSGAVVGGHAVYIVNRVPPGHGRKPGPGTSLHG
jgi:hypothetical protein